MSSHYIYVSIFTLFSALMSSDLGDISSSTIDWSLLVLVVRRFSLVYQKQITDSWAHQQN